MSHPEKIKCKKVAVVVLGYNSRNYLEKFLPSVIATAYDDFTTVYVDNASDDDSVAFVEKNFPDVPIFRIYTNRGFTNGYEESLPHIEAEYYVLLNSDVEVDPNWLAPMMKLMEDDKTIGACQPKVIHQPSPPLFDYAGASGGFMDKYGYTFCRGRLFNHVEEDEHQYDDIREIFWATGACMLVRAKLYHQLEGLDNDFYAHMEEIDLCWRIKNAGYKILVVPEGVVYHVGGTIIKYGSFTKIYHNYRNNLVMLFKNLPANKVWHIIPCRLALDNVAAAKALFTGNFTEFRGIVAALFQFVFRLGKWMGNRKAARKHVERPNMTGVYNRSVVLDFFLRKKKIFADLNLKYLT